MHEEMLTFIKTKVRYLRGSVSQVTSQGPHFVVLDGRRHCIDLPRRTIWLKTSEGSDGRVRQRKFLACVND